MSFAPQVPPASSESLRVRGISERKKEMGELNFGKNRAVWVFSSLVGTSTVR